MTIVLYPVFSGCLKSTTARFVVAVVVPVMAILAVGCGSHLTSQSENPKESTSNGPDSKRAEPAVFTKGPDMKSRRERFAMVKLTDGRLMAVGGRAVGLQAQSGNYNETAELFDPVNTEWTFTGDMNEQRRSPALFALPDGRVMVAGGLSGQREPLGSTEIWNPLTGDWDFGPPMNRPHDLMATVVLPDGRFVMIGGASKNENGLLISLNGQTEAYDPTSQKWSDLASMNEDRANHTATLLSDGRVLVTGGGRTDGPYLKSTEIYDPLTDDWKTGAEMSKGRAFHTATLLEDGRVLVVGGKGKIKQTELYDPDLDAWTLAGNTTDARSGHTATLLSDGIVLVVGGTGYLATSELFNIETGSWSIGELLITGRYRHSAFHLEDSRTLIMGGTSKDGMLATTEIYAAK